MKIERTENGINWTDEGGGGGIHLVPMVYVSDTDPEAYQKYLEHIAKRMIPVPHTVEETLAYLQQKYPCIPLEPGHEIRLAFQYSVLRSCLEKKNASDTPRFSMDMSDEAFAALLEEEARRRQEAMDARPEDFGLRLHCYRVPNSDLFAAQKRAAEEALRTYAKRHPERSVAIPQNEDSYFCLEETTGMLAGRGLGGGELLAEYIGYYGVTQEDIDQKTPRFHRYLLQLVEEGKLPSYQAYSASRQ